MNKYEKKQNSRLARKLRQAGLIKDFILSIKLAENINPDTKKQDPMDFLSDLGYEFSRIGGDLRYDAHFFDDYIGTNYVKIISPSGDAFIVEDYGFCQGWNEIRKVSK